MFALDRIVLEAINGLASHSWALDSLLGILNGNALAKGAIIGACLMAAWYWGKGDAQVRNRRILLTALLACVSALAVTKILSHAIFFPRPYFYSEKIYHLSGDKLVEYDTLHYNVPLDDESQLIYTNYLDGKFVVNHLGTFPSDNASFFIAICLGVILVFRSVGVLVLLWTVFVVLGTKIYFGQHFLSDILCGIAVALVMFFAWKMLTDRPLRRSFDRAARWTLDHPVLSSAIMFVVVFEIASALVHIYPIIEYVQVIGKKIVGL